MSTSVLEIATIPLKSTNSLHLGADKSTEEQTVVNEALKVLKEQSGFRNAAVGLKVEDNDVALVFVEWDSVEAHTKFTQQPYFQPFLDNWSSAVDPTNIKIVHYHPTKPAKDPLSAPVTEVLWWYFANDALVKDYADVWDPFADNMVNLKGEGVPLSVACGWADEEVEFKNQNEETVKGKAFVCLIGWDSLEDHVKLSQRPEFEEQIPKVREPVSGAEMYHVVVGGGGRKSW